jgi:hypothetical protein
LKLDGSKHGANGGCALLDHSPSKTHSNQAENGGGRWGVIEHRGVRKHRKEKSEDDAGARTSGPCTKPD